MPYYEEIVAEYLCSNRKMFVSPTFNLDLNEGGPLVKDKNWWIDVLAVDFGTKTIFLCEVSYSKTLYALARRLKLWASEWENMRAALTARTGIDADWKMQPWVFTPRDLEGTYKKRFAALGPVPFEYKWMALECTAPWMRPEFSQIAAQAKADRQREQGDDSAGEP